MRRCLALFAVTVVFLGCSAPSQSQSGGPDGGPTATSPSETEETSRRPDIAQYETFDPSKYPTEPPRSEVELTHEVPDRLMRARADEGVKQTVEGFRIQVFSAEDQQAAQEFREEVRQWWQKARKTASTNVFRTRQPSIVIEYSQPYYRVRIGAFAERDAAEDALSFVREEYPGAFVARSTVTVTR